MYMIVLFALVFALVSVIRERQAVSERSRATSGKIPRVVHQIFMQGADAIPACVREVMDRNKASNPDYEFRLYDLRDIERYIRDHTTPAVYDAFRLLNPKCHACVADLFRYVVVFREGGVYLDIKTEISTPLRDWVKDKVHLSMWPWYPHSHLEQHYPKSFGFLTNNRELNQSVLMYPPKHPILGDVIAEVVRRIRQAHDEPSKAQSVLSITGPHVYTEVVAKHLERPDIEVHQSKDHMYDGHIEYDGTRGCYHDHIKRKQNSWQRMRSPAVV